MRQRESSEVTVDLVLLAEEDHRSSQDALGLGETSGGVSGTYVVVGGSSALGGGLPPASRAAAPGLLVVELQVLQALGQGQLLLDGHAEERVQGLLLVLGGGQLALHVVQLGDVLVAAAGEKKRMKEWKEKMSWEKKDRMGVQRSSGSPLQRAQIVCCGCGVPSCVFSIPSRSPHFPDAVAEAPASSLSQTLHCYIRKLPQCPLFSPHRANRTVT